MAYKDKVTEIALDFFTDRLHDMLEENPDLKEWLESLPKPLRTNVVKTLIDSMFENEFEKYFWEWWDFYNKIQPILDRDLSE